jgi:SLOG-like protein
MLGGVLHLFVQMLERNFGFFHSDKCKIDNRSFKAESDSSANQFVKVCSSMSSNQAPILEPPPPTGSALTASSQRADEIFLEGPRSRFDEFVTLLRVVRDFLRGFRVLHFVGPCVTVFGSARIKIDNPYYALAQEMGAGIAQLGFTVMTGGGPGIMEAANRGARKLADAQSGAASNFPLSRNQMRISIVA